MIVLIFTVLPLLLALVIQYITCRLTMRQTGRYWKFLRYLRLLPALLSILVIVYITVSRWQIWRNQDVSPLTQVLFFPGVPGFFFLLGLFAGWGVWKKRWSPKVIREK